MTMTPTKNIIYPVVTMAFAVLIAVGLEQQGHVSKPFSAVIVIVTIAAGLGYLLRQRWPQHSTVVSLLTGCFILIGFIIKYAVGF